MEWGEWEDGDGLGVAEQEEEVFVQDVRRESWVSRSTDGTGRARSTSAKRPIGSTM